MRGEGGGRGWRGGAGGWEAAPGRRRAGSAGLAGHNTTKYCEGAGGEGTKQRESRPAPRYMLCLGLGAGCRGLPPGGRVRVFCAGRRIGPD